MVYFLNVCILCSDVTLSNLQRILSDSEDEHCDPQTKLASSRSSPDININSFDDFDHENEVAVELEPSDARNLINQERVVHNQKVRCNLSKLLKLKFESLNFI